jgi:hypothetical protein
LNQLFRFLALKHKQTNIVNKQKQITELAQLAQELSGSQLDQLLAELHKLRQVKTTTLSRIRGVVIDGSTHIHPVCKS